MRRLMACLLLAAPCFLSTSCRKDDIEVLRVPKEAAPALPAALQSGGGDRAGVHWKAPAGWKENPPSQMRAGSFTASANGQPIDISVVALAGDAGGELANVNRWRGQLSLPPVDEAALKDIARPATAGPHKITLVEFSSEDGARRLLAAILARPDKTWFFKATGDTGAVKSIKPAFLNFVGGVRFDHEQ
ncbi:MAG: hypothetical protein JO102_00605 [Elusimicrobia bacterium]|nr:hypothetical protein [Elusimicrobiota bacterium]